MLRIILELLKDAEPTTEALKIAKGRYYLPKRFKDINKVCRK